MGVNDIDAAAGALLDTGGPSTPSPVAAHTIDNVAYQDFLTYRYLTDPADTRVLTMMEVSTEAVEYLDFLEEQGAGFETLEYVGSFLAALESDGASEPLGRSPDHTLPGPAVPDFSWGGSPYGSARTCSGPSTCANA